MRVDVYLADVYLADVYRADVKKLVQAATFNQRRLQRMLTIFSCFTGAEKPLRVAHALVAAVLSLLFVTNTAAQDGPLPSWNATPTRAAIIAFVERVTNPESADYLSPGERIAVFDNDGNLWAEQPAYFQLQFVLDQLQLLAPAHPEWLEQQPFKAAIEGDMKALAASGEAGLIELLMATHAGMSSAAFAAAVSDWLEQARHPRFDKPYNELTYLPMRELLDYLTDNGFTNFIVSGGGVAFMRAWAPAAYGIPAERIIGSRVSIEYVSDEQGTRLERRADIAHINDKGGKPVGIQQIIGRRPVFASGNSDGDFQMLEWTSAGEGPRFALLLHHTDSEREWAYDSESHVGRLDRALSEAGGRGWTVVDMAKDWNKVFAFQE
jgi:phosphoserine phosphatase